MFIAAPSPVNLSVLNDQGSDLAILGTVIGVFGILLLFGIFLHDGFGLALVLISLAGVIFFGIKAENANNQRLDERAGLIETETGLEFVDKPVLDGIVLFDDDGELVRYLLTIKDDRVFFAEV